MKILIHYGEIWLKGKNRPFFESKLLENIRTALERSQVEVEALSKERGRMLCSIAAAGAERAEEALRDVLGLKHFAFPEEVESTEEAILEKAAEVLGRLKESGKQSVGLSTSRADKRFPLTSLELNKKIGAEANRKGLRINFRDPDETLHIEIAGKTSYLYTRKISGPGGLPVSVSGKVLALLSGGIDSAVAAWLLMKRGCRVDFLHFHAYRENEEVLGTKIPKLVEQLNRYQFRSRLFLAPYYVYDVQAMGRVAPGLDLVVFKNFMFRVAQRLARQHRYKVLVSGDSVGQVASQTLDNLAATDYGIELPVLRPLAGSDKEEIIALARRIGTYEESIGKYKDCCSIISRRPSTSVKVEELRAALPQLGIEELMEKTLGQLGKFDFGRPAPATPEASLSRE